MSFNAGSPCIKNSKVKVEVKLYRSKKEKKKKVKYRSKGKNEKIVELRTFEVPSQICINLFIIYEVSRNDSRFDPLGT